jgi:hypothetical protein
METPKVSARVSKPTRRIKKAADALDPPAAETNGALDATLPEMKGACLPVVNPVVASHVLPAVVAWTPECLQTACAHLASRDPSAPQGNPLPR